MEFDLSVSLADFLEGRLGTILFLLRNENEEYRRLSNEYESLLNGVYENADEYRQALSRLAEVGKKKDDIEKHYIFLSGIREHLRLEQVLTSEYFKELFADIKKIFTLDNT